MQKEIWKDIKGYEGMYQVSNLGNIYSYKYNRLLKPQLGGKGYWVIGLCKNAIRILKSIHRLKAIAFIPNIENKPYINHIDGVKTNNSLENLEWCTHGENMKHSRLNGLNNDVGDNHHNSKLTESDVLLIRSYNDKTDFEISKLFNVTRKNIWAVRNYKTWNHVR